MVAELVLHYPRASVATDHSIVLATAGDQGTPAFFDGYAEQPAQTAQALLCIARVARTRFYEPPGMIAARIAAADPVVTSEPDRLRFEAFSACCGVHARYDVLPDGLDVRACAPGTTNVDFNPPMREVLARISHRDPMRITVGTDAVQVATLDSAVVERKVPLPDRWVKGFGEVQVAANGMVKLAELPAIEAQRFIKSLPRAQAGNLTMWADSSGRSLRLTRVRRAGAVCVAAPTRLRVLEPLTRFARSLSVYGDPDAREPTAVTWVLTLSTGRVAITLSPERNRGFSGEGALLMDLISDEAASDALAIQAAATGRARFTVDDAAAAAQLPSERIRPALTWLGVHGHIGYDTGDGVFFHRRLPYPESVLHRDPTRLRDARTLAADGAVQPLGNGMASVFSEDREYRTEVADGSYRCSCPWIAKHGTTRGPCKHILATGIVISHHSASDTGSRPITDPSHGQAAP